MKVLFDFLAEVNGDREAFLAAGPEVLAALKELAGGLPEPFKHFTRSAKNFGIEYYDLVVLLGKAHGRSPTRELLGQLEAEPKVNKRKKMFTAALDHAAIVDDLKAIHENETAWKQLVQRLKDLGVPAEKRLNGLFPKPKFGMTDVANSHRFAKRFKGRAIYCGLHGCWYIFNGKRWRRDDNLQVIELAKEAVKAILDEEVSAVPKEDKDRRDALIGWFLKSEEARRINAMVSLARGELPVDSDRLDADPWLLNCENGTVDLRTGIRRDHDPRDLITKIAPIDFLPDATCPKFDAVLDQIFAVLQADGTWLPNKKLIAFFWRVLGYCLTGSTKERIMFVWWGDGDNGKTLLMGLIQLCLGDYAEVTPPETLLAQEKSAIPNDVAKLKGARVVFASETEAGQRFAMARIKALTGGDEKISARFMRQEWFNFVFNGKINLLTNHRPKAPHDEKAFWNRICPIPFTTTFKLDPTVRKEPGETLVLQKDPDLNKKLEAEELPGILARMVKESVAWAERGLEIPAAVTEEKAKYKAEQNPFPHFFADCTVQVPEAKVTVADMQKCYADWSAAGSRKAQSSYRLRDAIMALGGIEKKRDWQVPGEPWTWFGIGLVAAPVAAEKDAF